MSPACGYNFDIITFKKYQKRAVKLIAVASLLKPNDINQRSRGC